MRLVRGSLQPIMLWQHEPVLHAAASKDEAKAALKELGKEFEEAAKGNKDLALFTGSEVEDAANRVMTVMASKDVRVDLLLDLKALRDLSHLAGELLPGSVLEEVVHGPMSLSDSVASEVVSERTSSKLPTRGTR